jgi:cell wall-associated NlpC family hydrolase
VRYAQAQVGKRYVFATSGPNTFDCSGLVVASYRQIGISLPHQTGGLAGRGRAVSRAQLQPGDLVFASSSHVGIYVGGGMMVHASNPRTGVKRSSIYTFAFARRIVG